MTATWSLPYCGHLECADYLDPDCRDEYEALPVAVVDMDSASEPGEQFTVVARFATAHEAETWIDQHADQEKVERGGFGIDVPEPCCYVSFQTRGAQHHVTCEEY